MWLDAFIRPNSTNMQKTGVSGVSGVSAPRKANEYKGLAEMTPTDTGLKSRCQSVSAVSVHINRLTPLTPTDTAIKTGCQSDEAPRKVNEYKGLANRLTPLTPLTPEKHHVLEISDVLQLFRFDLVQQEIEDGYPADELRRVNNIAWRLMTAQGFGFDEAIKAAAEWVISSPAHQDESALIDVMGLFKGLMQ